MGHTMVNIASVNGLSPNKWQAIMYLNTDFLFIK